MCITLDRPIYRILDIKVKAFDKDNLNREISIKDYIYENTVYQALNNNATGKGLALMYTIGDRQIKGLGAVPEPTKFFAAMNWDTPWYVIQKIIEDATSKEGNKVPAPIVHVQSNRMNSVSDFQYKIVYIPYVNGKVYTEQSNISGLKNYTYKNLNQENPTVYDSSFGKSAQTQVERLGNNTISKTFRRGISQFVPSLGDIREFDGYYYYADTIVNEYGNNYMDSTVSFSKNFNKINERIGIDSEYRIYGIATKGIVDRSINFNSYWYLSTSYYPEESITGIMAYDTQLRNDILSSFYNQDYHLSLPHLKPDTLYVRPYSRNSKYSSARLKYTDYYGNLTDVPCSIIPVQYNKYQNSIAFTASFLDNYSTGIQNTERYDPPKAFIQTFYEDTMNWVEPPYQYKNQDVRYVNNDGECPYMGLSLFGFGNTAFTKLSAGLSLSEYSRAYPRADFITDAGLDLRDSTIAHIPREEINNRNLILDTRIKLDKDTKEKLTFVYQLHFQTFDKNLHIQSGMTRRLYSSDYRTLDPNYVDTKPSPQYILFKGSLVRKDSISNQTEYTTVGTPEWGTHFRNGISIIGMNITPDKSYDGYALVWPDNGEIIFSYKQDIPANEPFRIPNMYLSLFHNKLPYKNN